MHKITVYVVGNEQEAMLTLRGKAYSVAVTDTQKRFKRKFQSVIFFTTGDLLDDLYDYFSAMYPRSTKRKNRPGLFVYTPEGGLAGSLLKDERFVRG